MRHFLGCFLLLSYYSWSQPSQLILVENGKSKYVVTINEKPSSSEERAASILRYYVKKSTAVNLPISTSKNINYRIHFEEEPTLPQEGFFIYSESNNLFVKGGKSNGVVNGALCILKQYFNVDFVSVDNIYTTLTKNVSIAVPLSIRQTPSFSMRTMHSTEGYDQDYIETHSLQLPFLEKNTFKSSFNIDLLPTNRYLGAHPEYYIMRGGKRDTSQPNLYNEDVFKIVLQEVKKRAREDVNNKFKYYNINLNDNPFFDESLATAKASKQHKETFAFSYFNFINRIADSFPDKIITALAYEQTKAALPGITPRKNVAVVLTNADNNKSKPLIVDDYDNQQQIHMKREIPLWLAKDADLIFWDYIANYTNSLMPWPNLYTIKPNLQYYKQAGIRNILLQHAGLFPSENRELKAYLSSNLMWNVNYNDDSLIQVFCQHFFMQSWKVVYQYINDINRQAFQGKDIMYTYDNPAKFSQSLFSHKNISKWRDMLTGAEKDAESELIRKRIMKERLGLDCVFIELSVTVNKWNPIDDKVSLLKKINTFQNDAKLLNITTISEAEPSFAKYISRIKGLLK